MLLLFLVSNFGQVFSKEKRGKHEVLEYSVRKEGCEKKCFPIKSAFAEYFKSNSGKDLLFLVFYPYKIPAKKWRSVYDYRKKDPENFAVIKLEIHGPAPIGAGSYPSDSAPGSGKSGKGTFYPTLITSKDEYRGTTGTGVLTITDMDLKIGGSIFGYFYYRDDDFEISGPFKANFILDK